MHPKKLDCCLANAHLRILGFTVSYLPARFKSRKTWSKATYTVSVVKVDNDPRSCKQKSTSPNQRWIWPDNIFTLLWVCKSITQIGKPYWIDSWIWSMNRSQQIYDKMTWQVDYTMTWLQWHRQPFTILWAPMHTEKTLPWIFLPPASQNHQRDTPLPKQSWASCKESGWQHSCSKYCQGS